MLEDFGVVGVSWQQRGSEALAAYALGASGDDSSARLREFARQADLGELAYLETCNRVEVVFRRQSAGRLQDVRPLAFALLAGRPPEPGEAERAFRAWQGEGACEHLFLVAAGLDSAALGEADVAGQVRAAHEQAVAAGLSGPGLKLLFEEALRIAAAVRTDTRLGAGSVSLAEVALGHVRARLRRNPGLVALIGVSPMTTRAARALADDGAPFVVVNRTLERAQALARSCGGQALSLDAFAREPPPLAAAFVSTGAKEPVLGPSELRAVAAGAPPGEPPLCIDMAVPANIDAESCATLGIRRIGMDEIVAEAERNRRTRLEEAGEARVLVDAALPRLRRRFAERAYGPLFAALRNHYQDAAEASIRRLEKNLGRRLSAGEQQATSSWAGALARQLAHLPIAGLKGLLHGGPEGALDAFLGGLDADLAADLRGLRGQHGNAAPASRNGASARQQDG